MSKLLNKTVGMCYKIIPINVRTGCNVASSLNLQKYEWFGSTNVSLKQLILEDQLRTNFDEGAYKKLCNDSLKMQLVKLFRVAGVGTVVLVRVERKSFNFNKVKFRRGYC